MRLVARKLEALCLRRSLQPVNRGSEQRGVHRDDMNRHPAQQIGNRPLAVNARMNPPSCSCGTRRGGMPPAR